MKELPKKYNHLETEAKWQQEWEKCALYRWNPEIARENSFVIDTPPPTVSGILHMGHIFSYTQTDFIARFQRMKGKNVFYPMGFDDNGLPTERLVEKVKKVRGVNMEREEFVSLCKEVVIKAEEEFRNLFKSIALSVDWSQEYQTINDDSKAISQMSFLDLYNKGRAYRQQEAVLWDVIDRTALAQADIEDKEMKGVMYDIPFSTEQGEKLTIATTRPELLPACVAVFCHPNDERYKKFIGLNILTPLFNEKVKLIADEKVDIEKGTGLVMCCTFGDATDVEWWKIHKLATRIIIGKDGKLKSIEEIRSSWSSLDSKKEEIYNAYLAGLKVNEAKENIVSLLDENGLILDKKEVSRPVKCAERSGAPIEILVTDQWFIKLLDQKKELHEKVNQCSWHPAFMKKRVEAWIDGLNWDWCISRQRFFGVPIPVWYSMRAGEEGKILLPDIKALPVDPLKDLPLGYSRDEVIAEKDVMDTWATSSVSPQLNSKAISQEFALDFDRHQKLFPADLRPQAHEIIRTWAFYTIAKAHMHENTIPWKNLMISGWVLAADKSKMSKSKGNVVTPVDLIHEKSADAVRYWASNSKLGMDIAYSEDTFKIGKKLITKLWNASKFACLHLSKINKTPTTPKEEIVKGVIYEDMDLWILTCLKNAISKATAKFEQFEYSEARVAAEDFFWKDFCDNYLEIVKSRAYDEQGQNPKGQQSAITTIYFCLENILKLFAPLLPHITEELYSHIFENRGSIHQAGQWPTVDNFIEEDKCREVGEAVVNILDAVRVIKSEKQLSIKAPIKYISIARRKHNPECLASALDDLCAVTNTQEIKIVDKLSAGHITADDMFEIDIVFEDINV